MSRKLLSGLYISIAHDQSPNRILTVRLNGEFARQLLRLEEVFHAADRLAANVEGSCKIPALEVYCQASEGLRCWEINDRAYGRFDHNSCTYGPAADLVSVCWPHLDKERRATAGMLHQYLVAGWRRLKQDREVLMRTRCSLVSSGTPYNPGFGRAVLTKEGVYFRHPTWSAPNTHFPWESLETLLPKDVPTRRREPYEGRVVITDG